MPIDLIIGLTVLALISASTCFVLKRWGSSLHQDSQQSLITLTAVFCGGIALFALSDFPISGSPLLQMPGALIILLPCVTILGALFSFYKIRLSPLRYGLFLLICLTITHLSSFPWWNRGIDGWVSLICICLSGGIFSLFMHQALAQSPQRAIVWWAIHAIICVPLLFGVTALGHAQAMLILLTPIAIGGFVSWILHIHSFANPSTTIAVCFCLCVLLGNSNIRFVANPDDPAAITWILRLAPISLCISAAIIAWANRHTDKKRHLLNTLAITALICTATGVIYAYSYEGESDTSSSDASDFYYK